MSDFNGIIAKKIPFSAAFDNNYLYRLAKGNRRYKPTDKPLSIIFYDEGTASFQIYFPPIVLHEKIHEYEVRKINESLGLKEIEAEDFDNKTVVVASFRTASENSAKIEIKKIYQRLMEMNMPFSWAAYLGFCEEELKDFESVNVIF